MKELSKGYNIVGLSQGSLIGRGIVEFCEGAPPVRNLISVAAPQAGVASIPLNAGGTTVRTIANSIMKAGAYSDYAQKRFAPTGYIKLPKLYILFWQNIKGYLKSCKFLPKLNNERPNDRNPAYKKRFSSLKNLVLIMNENDTTIRPKESSWFGYYEDGSTKKVLQPREVPSSCNSLSYTPKVYIDFTSGLYCSQKNRFISSCFNNSTPVSLLLVRQLRHDGHMLDSVSTNGNVTNSQFNLQTKLYMEDWIGLKKLDKAGRVKFIKVEGNHLQISGAELLHYIIPYLQ
ncbi:PREDICTED: palmitoyl-protein thioesterase 1-like [Erythranthe guttata]|uniref:palmitoyl-protein thioesterase 1-like n=1 Tax=Erythranthe guttata TaxID=4155 RepID=UPI00064DC85B|nr:PREDICTED: palmitoyl-protein thioesterase 1-like [Erythranthe guttata]|eukprot:XP_012827284.1 PREDICTED: palmitoyl-protein thioesterase 1-like [Erythranthe guttata]